MKLIYLLLLLSGCIALNQAWKPIVGQAPTTGAALTGSKATSATFTSSFSLQQSHPDFSSKSGYVAEGGSKELYIKEVPEEVLTVKSSYSPLTASTAPPVINFGDARFGYKSPEASYDDEVGQQIS